MANSGECVLAGGLAPAHIQKYGLFSENALRILRPEDTVGEFSTDDDGRWWWSDRQSPRVVITRSDRHLA